MSVSGHTHLPVIASDHARKEAQSDQHGATGESCRLGGPSPDGRVTRVSAKGGRACLRIDQASYCRVHSEIDLDRADSLRMLLRHFSGKRVYQDLGAQVR
jgi:hypothetical protein